MMYTVTIDKSIDTIKNEIAHKVKEFGFGVLNQYSFKDMLEEKGHPIEKDITVFEVCNPVAAQKALSKYPEVSPFLPCRISLYEKDGHVMLSTIGIDGIVEGFSHFDDDFKEEMFRVFETLKNIMKSLA